MIVVLSRFRIANSLEAEVTQAFRHRPHLVDEAPGFLGLETFVEEQDECMFHLLTRWTDFESYRRWHTSASHRDSHKHMPKGLKLDAAFTQVLYLKKVSD